MAYCLIILLYLTYWSHCRPPELSNTRNLNTNVDINNIDLDRDYTEYGDRLQPSIRDSQDTIPVDSVVIQGGAQIHMGVPETDRRRADMNHYNFRNDLPSYQGDRSSTSPTSPSAPPHTHSLHLRQPPNRAPDYMLHLYAKFSSQHAAYLDSNIARSFANINQESDAENEFVSIIGQQTRIHTLAFNIITIKPTETINIALLRLYTLVQHDRQTYHGVDRKVSLYEVAIDNTTNGDLMRLIESKYVYGEERGWEVFDVTSPVQSWVRNNDSLQVIEVRIETLTSTTNNDDDVDIETSVYSNNDPIIVVFSNDFSQSSVIHEQERNAMVAHEHDTDIEAIEDILYNDTPSGPTRQKRDAKLSDSLAKIQRDHVAETLSLPTNPSTHKRVVTTDSRQSNVNLPTMGKEGQEKSMLFANEKRKYDYPATSNQQRRSESVYSPVEPTLPHETHDTTHYTYMLKSEQSYTNLTYDGRRTSLPENVNSRQTYKAKTPRQISRNRRNTDDGQKRRSRKGRQRKSRRSNRHKRMRRNECQKKPMYVNFEDINWHNWIIAPRGFQAYECVGRCYFPLDSHLSPTKHAVIQALMHAVHPRRLARACCVPTRLEPISILFVENGVVTYKYKYDGMVVAECGCR